MSSQKGMLLTCDRCGEWVFLAHTGKKDADGGYTVWDTFEKEPDGWDRVNGIGTVCPMCHKEYKDMLEKYRNNVRRVKEG